MSRKMMSEYKFLSSYAKWNENLNRKETWPEAVDRVFGMHERRFQKQLTNPKFKELFDFAKQAYIDKKVLASMRSLQFGGESLEKHHAKMFNCMGTNFDRVDTFGEIMYLLLCGCGVGFSVQTHHIDKLPNLITEKPDKNFHKFQIPDSIEGWADAIQILLSSYFIKKDHKFSEYSGYNIDFDYSLIRPKDSMISGGFKAPGPDGLRNAINKIKNLFDKLLAGGVTKIRPIHVYDIIMHSSDAVLSGGIRRSALIALFSKEDDEMMSCKTGNWVAENPQRARSNNSVVLPRQGTSFEDFMGIISKIKEFGEPGFYFSDNKDQTTNPCLPADTIIDTDLGMLPISELIGKQFKVNLDGKQYEITSNGFFSTGVKPVRKIVFESGRELKATDNHQIMTPNGWVEAGDLKVGDEVKLNENKNILNIDYNSDEWKRGYLIGSFMGDGNIDTNNERCQLKYWGENSEYMKENAFSYIHDVGYGKPQMKKTFNKKSPYQVINSTMLYDDLKNESVITENNKKNFKTPNLINGSKEYISGLISGLFDADGTVAFNLVKGSSIRLGSIHTALLKNIQIALSGYGIKSKIYTRRKSGNRMLPLNDGKGGHALFYCNKFYELIISKDSINQYSKMFKFLEKDKQEKVDLIVSGGIRKPYKTKFTDKISEIYQDYETVEVYDLTVKDIHAFSANGVYVHNCVEITFHPIDEKTGNTGFQGCNLCEINGAACITEQDFYDACKAASIIGTMQASYTDFKYLTDTSKNICDREALLGVSITGMMNNPDICFDPLIQQRGAEIVKSVNKEVAKIIGINPAARTTCVKPSGNSSVLLGCSSGIHGEHAPRYFRNVQINKSEEEGCIVKLYNPTMVEESVWSPNKTDDVISFLIESPKNSIYKKDLDGVRQLEYVKTTQQNWVKYGTDPNLCTVKDIMHNVSNTISVDDWDEVAKFIYENKDSFTGVSLLSNFGDKDYNQAPFTTVINEKEIVRKYGNAGIFASGLIVDGLKAFNNNLWDACSTVLGYGEKLRYTFEEIQDEIDKTPIEQCWKNLGYSKRVIKKLVDSEMKPTPSEYQNFMGDRLASSVFNYGLKLDFLRRAEKFSRKYFQNDLKEMTYCLKDIYNWHKWVTIDTNFVPIEWVNENLSPNYISADTLAGAACSGGACDLEF